MEKEYKLINVLKFFCAILIVIIHTGNRMSNIGYLFIVISRIAVPIFFMISGYFLCEKIYDKKIKSINKYVMNIFKIYVIWSIVYIIFDYPFFIKYNTIKDIIFNLLRRFIFIGTYYHLWYLITCCFAMYIIYFFVNKCGLKISLVVSSILYIISIFADSYYGILPEGNLKYLIDLYITLFGEVWNGFEWILIFILFGIMIKKYNINKKIKNSKLKLFVILSLYVIEHFILRYLNIARDNNTSIFLLLLAPLVFIYTLNLEDKINISLLNKNNVLLKDLSIIIYLIHPLIILYVNKFTGIGNSFLLFIVVFNLSIIFAYFYNYIKNKMLGIT